MNLPPRVSTVPSSWLRALVLPLIILAWLAVVMLAGWLLSHLTKTILMVVLAAVLAFAFTPLANALRRWMPRALAITVAYLIGLSVVIGCGAYLVGTTVAEATSLVGNISEYARQARSLQPQLERLLYPLGIQQSWLTNVEEQALGQVQAAGTQVAKELIPRVAEFFGTIVDLVLVLILSVYLCLDGARIAEWLRTETPDGRTRDRARVLVAVVNRVVGGYIRGVLILALLIGALVGVGMALLGVPYAALLGVLAFFMEFIPVLGVFISGAAALIITVVHFGDVWHPLLVLAYFIVVHVIEGDVVGPRIMGRAVGIHPATGLIALVAGTEVWGIWGALFAAPLAGLIQAILVAAWIEMRGGHPSELLQAVADETSEHVERTEQQAGVA
jgi:predicted PurR-regulated permease PerM